MIQIKVTGEVEAETGAIISIIQKALKDSGKRTLIANTKEVVGDIPGPVDCVVIESPILHVSNNGTKKFDYLIGLTEAAAYELAQTDDFQVRIVSRNGIPMVVTRDVKPNRVNLRITHNTVVGWYIG